MPLVVLVGEDGVAFISLLVVFNSHWSRNAFAIYYPAID